ncbi:hypothetical protein M2451_000423 [Dysgonomonas sp. PFB1-18]|uniref:hypothetical protein n=1 Tax=unclassified Dysgonomonas TaxID=2630389 RepID=UPI0024743A94|nr:MULTISPECIES: hypothetical protein [unclassified Dysgonomonas]MDH6307274.1 hypothetical protein [Dysgonomonas sp. PF1-14]MDH6337192.1 hypothetical protein [Dysgonomonas sp. PF1-16]MDH6379116.1 hypothetical protein [Dysgonomonas sp. PFB1-18]MDH6396247.1 hypothetical protein [Dysgonomonas sp. PF1-23]
MSTISKELINLLKERTREKGQAVNLLMDTIPIGKEAAYRRLRGEIPFSLEEAAAICRKLNVSLDVLAGMKNSDVYGFYTNAIVSDDPMSGYNKMLRQIVDTIEYLKNIPGSISYRAYTALPHEFVFKYDSLSQMYIRILFYQLYMFTTPQKLIDIEIPADVNTNRKAVASVMQDIEGMLILDRHVFREFIEIVRYFHGLGMLADKTIAEIKRDLHLMLNDLERCAFAGLSLHGKKLDIYISQISFDCSYNYIEGADIKACSLGVYCIDHLSSDNPQICERHKIWIKSLVRFSTLISISGELQRNEYFSTQREVVDALL